VTESFGSGVDRQDLAGRERIRIGLGISEDDVLSRGHLSSVIEADRARHEQGLSHHNRPVQEWLAGPDALQDTTLIPKHGMKNSQTAAGGKHSFSYHPADAGDFLSYLCLGERGNRGCVYIAVGEVPEEVTSRPYAEAVERFGAPLSDALQEFDRRVQPDNRGGPGGHPQLGGLDRGFREEILGEPIGIERLEILDGLTQANKANRERQLAPDRRNRTAACTAVELGHDDAGG
jgi:hypothetical protein